MSSQRLNIWIILCLSICSAPAEANASIYLTPASKDYLKIYSQISAAIPHVHLITKSSKFGNKTVTEKSVSTAYTLIEKSSLNQNVKEKIQYVILLNNQIERGYFGVLKNWYESIQSDPVFKLSPLKYELKQTKNIRLSKIFLKTHLSKWSQIKDDDLRFQIAKNLFYTKNKSSRRYLEELLKTKLKKKVKNEINFYLGELYYSLRDFENAADHYRSVLEGKKSKLKYAARYKLAWCHYLTYLKSPQNSQLVFKKGIKELLKLEKILKKSKRSSPVKKFWRSVIFDAIELFWGVNKKDFIAQQRFKRYRQLRRVNTMEEKYAWHLYTKRKYKIADYVFKTIISDDQGVTSLPLAYMMRMSEAYRSKSYSRIPVIVEELEEKYFADRGSKNKKASEFKKALLKDVAFLTGRFNKKKKTSSRELASFKPLFQFQIKYLKGEKKAKLQMQYLELLVLLENFGPAADVGFALGINRKLKQDIRKKYLFRAYDLSGKQIVKESPKVEMTTLESTIKVNDALRRLLQPGKTFDMLSLDAAKKHMLMKKVPAGRDRYFTLIRTTKSAKMRDKAALELVSDLEKEKQWGMIDEVTKKLVGNETISKKARVQILLVRKRNALYLADVASDQRKYRESSDLYFAFYEKYPNETKAKHALYRSVEDLYLGLFYFEFLVRAKKFLAVGKENRKIALILGKVAELEEKMGRFDEAVKSLSKLLLVEKNATKKEKHLYDQVRFNFYENNYKAANGSLRSHLVKYPKSRYRLALLKIAITIAKELKDFDQEEKYHKMITIEYANNSDEAALHLVNLAVFKSKKLKKPMASAEVALVDKWFKTSRSPNALQARKILARHLVSFFPEKIVRFRRNKVDDAKFRSSVAELQKKLEILAKELDFILGYNDDLTVVRSLYYLGELHAAFSKIISQSEVPANFKPEDVMKRKSDIAKLVTYLATEADNYYKRALVSARARSVIHPITLKLYLRTAVPKDKIYEILSEKHYFGVDLAFDQSLPSIYRYEW